MLFNITKYRHYLGALPGLLLPGQKQPENPLETPLVFQMSLDGEALQFPPVVTITAKKNVIVTKINGNNTLNVVEHVGGLSYEITIQSFEENNKVHEIEHVSTSKSSIARQVLNDLQSFTPHIKKSSGSGLYIKDNQFPLEGLENIVNLFKQNKSLEVEHDILNKAFGIYRLVLTGFNNIVFYPTAFSYELSAVADEPIELLL